MKVSLIQMDMKFASPDENFAHAEELIRQAAQSHPDVITLPETWNVGFFPKENLAELSDKDGARVKETFSRLASELNVNIVAGSVSNVRDGKIYTPPLSLTAREPASPSTIRRTCFLPPASMNTFSPETIPSGLSWMASPAA